MKTAAHEDPEVIRTITAPLAEQVATLARWGMPDTGVLILMSPCDGRCFFCAQREVTHMPAEMITAWPQIARWLEGAHEQPAARLLVGGTEPASHPQFAQALKGALDAGFSQVQLMTSGRRLALDGVAPAWRALGITEVCVPLYAADAVTHDAVTQVPGHWDEVTSGIERALAAGIRVSVHTLALNRTLAGLPALASLVATWGTRLVVAPLRDKDTTFDFAAEAPSYRALEAAIAGTDVALSGFPDCVAPHLPREAPDVIALYFRGQATRHAPRCGGCARVADCPGAVASQLSVHGDDELIVQG